MTVVVKCPLYSFCMAAIYRVSVCFVGRGRWTHVGRLHIVLKLGDGVLKVVETDLVVLDDQVDLQLRDTVADGHELGSSPDESVHLDGSHRLLELLHVGLVVPRLDVHRDDGLCRWLLLAGLLRGVLCQPLLTEVDGGLVLLLVFVGTEEVDVVVLGGGLGGRCLGLGRGSLWAVRGRLLARVTWQGGVLVRVGGDVRVPPGRLRYPSAADPARHRHRRESTPIEGVDTYVWVFRGGRGALQLAKDGDVSLRWLEALDIGPRREVGLERCDGG